MFPLDRLLQSLQPCHLTSLGAPDGVFCSPGACGASRCLGQATDPLRLVSPARSRERPRQRAPLQIRAPFCQGGGARKPLQQPSERGRGPPPPGHCTQGTRKLVAACFRVCGAVKSGGPGQGKCLFWAMGRGWKSHGHHLRPSGLFQLPHAQLAMAAGLPSHPASRGTFREGSPGAGREWRDQAPWPEG